MSSSSLLNVGRFERKFIRESAGTIEGDKLRYNDPSFVTFRILFDFEPYVSPDEVTQGLLLSEERDESGISYLRRMGEKGRAESLKEFRWMLSRISNDFPWFFKSISGIDSLWKWGYSPATQSKRAPDAGVCKLTIDCNETVDLRMTALADLYRKASYDRTYFRELLTIDKRRFNMTVLLGEARNIRSFMSAEESPGRTDWLDYVSAVAFRCFDCEFDFSNSILTTASAETYSPNSMSFSININRVQEANSYRLLGYMLGEIRRDIIIRNGGSGASFNDNRDPINYRGILSPFVQSYENNYSALESDIRRLKEENLVNGVEFKYSDPLEERLKSLPVYQQNLLRAVISKNQLDPLSEEEPRKSLGARILGSIERSAGITQGEPRTMDFGRPFVERDAQPNVDLDSPSVERAIQESVTFQEPKEEEDMRGQVEFNKPKVETSISDVSFAKPTVETVASSISFERPSVETNISAVSLQKPGIETELSNVELQAPNVEFGIPSLDVLKPSVETSLDDEVSLAKPTVERELSGIEFVIPSIENGIDGSVEFSIPSVVTEVPESVYFTLPTVDAEISLIEFGVPTVDDQLSKIELQAPKEEIEMSDDVQLGIPKVEVSLGS